MNFFIFADGYLQENEETFCYTIANNLFHTTTFDEHLKASNDRFGLELIDINKNADETEFVYKKEEGFSLLADVKEHSKPKIWKKKRDWLAFSIAYALQQEEEKGLFVLPIPENFLVGADSVKFIYKASEDMPITGFDPTQLFTHLKRLILYLYSEETFSELLEQKETKTSDKFLVALANTANFKELLELIPFTQEKEGSKEPKQLKVLPNKKVEIGKTVSQNNGSQKEETRSIGLSHIQKEKRSETPVVQTVVAKNQEVFVKKNKLLYVVVAISVLLLVVAGYLLFDKVTYPSQVQLLKNENSQLIEKLTANEELIEQLEQKNDDYEEKNKELSKNNKELEEEIEINVKTIKELVNKNDELKKSIKK